VSVFWRLLSIAALVVSAGVLFVAVRAVRRDQRVRPGLDLLRLGVTLATTLLMARLLGVVTPETFMGVGFLAGLLLGVYEGLHLRIRFLGRRAFARRTALGVAGWGVGVVVVQAAGVIGRVGLADLGLALSFLGIGQVVGLLTGRWQKVAAARRVGAGAIAGLVLAAVALGGVLVAGGTAGAAEAVDLRRVMAGEVPNLAVEVRGNGAYYGPALSLGFTNDAGGEAVVRVPVGLLFLPADEATQTMVSAGGESITVPATGRGEVFTIAIQAFCAQYHDEVPSAADVFTSGSVAGGDLGALVGLIHQGGVYGRAQQEAVWGVTDGYDLSGSPEAAALVEAAASGTRLLPVAAVDDDPENGLWDCLSNPGHRAGFGDRSEDRARCLTFRFEVPAAGIRSAVVYASIEAPAGSLQGTDTVAMAVGAAFPGQCELAGDMTGCVTLHSGFQGGERSLTLDLLDPACDATFDGTAEMQQAVRAQLETGAVHLILQDDTAVLGARLALNEGRAALPCGASARPAPLSAPEDDEVLGAGEGTSSAVAGLGGAAALLATSAIGAGGAPASAAAGAGRGWWRALRDAGRGGPSAGAGAPDWVDSRAVLHRGRAAAALEGLAPGLRHRVEGLLATRLETEQAEFLRKSLGPLDPAADPAGLVRADAKVGGMLARLPVDSRARVEKRLLAGLDEGRLAGATQEARGALRRDRVVEVLREALARRDGGRVQQVLAAVGDEEAARVWPRAASGLETEAGSLEYPAPEGPPEAGFDLEARLDSAVPGAPPQGGEAEAVLSRLPAAVRSRAEARLAEVIEGERVGRWVEKLRAVAGTEAAGGGVIGDPAARRLLETLPAGVRERVGEAAAAVLDGEAVERWSAEVQALVGSDRAAGLLQAAAGGDDGAGVNAILDAVDAALEVVGEADPDDRADRGIVVPPALGADLLGAAKRVAGVEEVLRRAGRLRPRVGAQVAAALVASRVEEAAAVVDRARRLDGVEEALRRAAARGDLEAIDGLLASLPAAEAAEVAAAAFA